jgi:CheY-like chemotaxis protein
VKKNAVMIVDDEEVDRYVLRRQLKLCKPITRIFESSDGSDALEFFRRYERNFRMYPDEYPPLIVFLDINMPKVNGHEFLAKFAALREDEELQSVNIIMFSSSERTDDIDHAMRYDFVADYLVKGQFSTEELYGKIANHL